MISFFEKFAAVLFEEFHNDIRYWITFNEIDATIHIPLTGAGIVKEHTENLEQSCYQALHHQFVASALVTKLAHEKYPELKIGCMTTKNLKYPATCKPEGLHTMASETEVVLFTRMYRFLESILIRYGNCGKESRLRFRKNRRMPGF